MATKECQEYFWCYGISGKTTIEIEWKPAMRQQNDRIQSPSVST